MIVTVLMIRNVPGCPIGTIREVSRAEANRLIARGFAQLVADPRTADQINVEYAVDAPAETASVRRTHRGRSRT